jgi:hypothetical protein
MVSGDVVEENPLIPAINMRELTDLRKFAKTAPNEAARCLLRCGDVRFWG